MQNTPPNVTRWKWRWLSDCHRPASFSEYVHKSKCSPHQASSNYQHVEVWLKDLESHYNQGLDILDLLNSHIEVSWASERNQSAAPRKQTAAISLWNIPVVLWDVCLKQLVLNATAGESWDVPPRLWETPVWSHGPILIFGFWVVEFTKFLTA